LRFSSIEHPARAGITEINNPGDKELKVFIFSKRSILVAGAIAATVIVGGSFVIPTAISRSPTTTVSASSSGGVLTGASGTGGNGPSAWPRPAAGGPVGTIPSDYTKGQGTLASRTTAKKAAEAALAVYPGGVVNRVVELGNGDYQVNYIGVNWPHYIFVNHDFHVIGADS
jgi:hypothetical protein